MWCGELLIVKKYCVLIHPCLHPSIQILLFCFILAIIIFSKEWVAHPLLFPADVYMFHGYLLCPFVPTFVCLLDFKLPESTQTMKWIKLHSARFWVLLSVTNLWSKDAIIGYIFPANTVHIKRQLKKIFFTDKIWEGEVVW